MGAVASANQTQKEILLLIKEKQERMVDDIKEIKVTVKDLDEAQRKFALLYTEEHERVVGSAEAAHKRIDEVIVWRNKTEDRIKAMEDALISQKTMNKVLVFIATIIGSAAIMFIWNTIIK